MRLTTAPQTVTRN